MAEITAWHQRGASSLALADGRVLWTAADDGTVMAAEVETGATQVLTDDGDNIGARVIDVDDTHAYFGVCHSAYWDHCPPASSRYVRRVPLTGGEATDVFGVDSPFDLAIAGDELLVAGRDLWRLPKGGGSATTIDLGGHGAVKALAVAGTSAYYAHELPDVLGRVALADESHGVIVSGHVVAIALDEAHVYYVRDERSGGYHERFKDVTIRRVSLDGGGEQLLASSPTWDEDIAVDSTHVYWPTWVYWPDWMGAPGIVRVAKAGGQVEVVVAGFYATRIALDERRVYWTDSIHDAVLSVPKQGVGTALSYAQWLTAKGY